MASRMKKMFHRKKDDEVQKSTVGSRPSNNVRSDPAIRSSLYEDTLAGTVPQTGDYPVKGNDPSVVLQQQGRKSSLRSLRSRRNSGSQHQPPVPAQYENPKTAPRMAPPPSSRAVVPGSYDPYQQDSGLAQNFSGLNIGSGQGPTTTTTTVTTTRFPQYVPQANRGPPQAQGIPNTNTNSGTRGADQDFARQGAYANRGAPQSHEYGDQNAIDSANIHSPQTQRIGDQSAQSSYASRGSPQTRGYDNQNVSSGANRDPLQTQTQGYGGRKAGVRVVNDSNAHQSPTSKPHRGGLPSHTKSNAYATQEGADNYEDNLGRTSSIPRKQIGTAGNAGYSSGQQSSPTNGFSGRNVPQSSPKPLPTTPANASNGHGASRNEAPYHSTSVLDRSRPISSKGATGPRSAQDVVNRAKSNTYDTEVIEKVAPAVVHETVHKEVHNVREEVITREIHTHDVYHRILPIIDVEVLPPRHFLPVEGGGLVEVSASEVPGRGQNWVIAETASKIPSDQAAPQGLRGFTARTFPGREGDAIEYMTPEGHQKTEQTWVHPPELEDGARLTGQSWPMMIGDEAPEKGTYGYASPKTSKKKHSRTSSKVSANPGQRGDGLGRSV